MTDIPEPPKPFDQRITLETVQSESKFPGATVHISLPDDHEFYKLIGRVVAEWASVEFLLDLMISELSGDDREASARATSITPVIDRLRQLEALVTQRLHFKNDFLQRLRVLEAMADDPRGCYKERNRIVHNAWFHVAGTAQIYQFMAHPRTTPFGMENVTIADMQTTIQAIRDFHKALGELRNEMVAAKRCTAKPPHTEPITRPNNPLPPSP